MDRRRKVKDSPGVISPIARIDPEKSKNVMKKISYVPKSKEEGIWTKGSFEKRKERKNPKRI